jgi:predicted nucleic acid-binding protein
MEYKVRQKNYRKAIQVLEEVLETKLDQVKIEPKQKMWKEHAECLRLAMNLVEEDIPYLNPNN